MTVRVYDHKLKRHRVLKRAHICTSGRGGCLRSCRGLGYTWYWCSRYSYAPKGQ